MDEDFNLILNWFRTNSHINSDKMTLSILTDERQYAHNQDIDFHYVQAYKSLSPSIVQP